MDAVLSAFEEDDADVFVRSLAALALWNDNEIWEMTADGTRSVPWTANELNIDRFVYISSTAVYGTHETHLITEDSPLNGVGPYGNAKKKS